MVNYQDLGRRVRALRRKNALTQEELAEKVGISASFLGHIERGSRIASLETFVLLCNALKASPQVLLAASLEDDLTEHMPSALSSDDRARLSTFLRMAQDTLNGWSD